MSGAETTTSTHLRLGQSCAEYWKPSVQNKSELPNLVLLRKERGLLQVQVAESLGYTERSIQRWEKGDSAPVIGDVRKLAAFFGVSVSYLIGESKERKLRPSALPD
ncbi:MAG: XRE family transcriptional regulator [Comamonadaceae bacterium]|nr:MAG: XRE family transcriptional regulator [Comamonadaceae bacterium]